MRWADPGNVTCPARIIQDLRTAQQAAHDPRGSSAIRPAHFSGRNETKRDRARQNDALAWRQHARPEAPGPPGARQGLLGHVEAGTTLVIQTAKTSTLREFCDSALPSHLLHHEHSRASRVRLRGFAHSGSLAADEDASRPASRRRLQRQRHDMT